LKKKIIIILLLLGAGIGGYALYARYFAPTLSSTGNIPSIPIQEGSFDITVSSIGILDAAVKKTITGSYSGKIIKIIPEGNFVKEGEPVLWLDTSDLEKNKEELEVEVQIAKSNLGQRQESYEVGKSKNELSLLAERAKVEFQKLKLEDSQINYEKQKILVAKNLSARSAEDEARIAFLQSELTLKQAEINLKKLIEDQTSDEKIKLSDVEKSKIELERQQNKLNDVLDNIDKAILKADGQGNVSYGVIWKGGKMGKISEGDQVWRRATLMEIPDPSTMQTLIPISEIDVGKVEVGQKAEIMVDSIPGKVFSGEVVTKSVVPTGDNRFPWGGGDTTPRGKEFEVRIKIDQIHESFRQGMTARARIFIKKLDHALFVPQEAVFEEKEGTFVFVKKDGGYEKKSVRVGPANDNDIVVEQGLKQGDAVFLRDPAKKIERIGILEGMSQRPEPMINTGK
jgi:multidrug resistance efflux pump